MGWLLLLVIPPAVIALIYFLPIRVKADYDENGLIIKAFLGLLKFHLYPDDGEDKLAFESVERSDGKASGNKAVRSGGRYAVFIAYARFVLDILNDLRKKIIIKQLYLKVTQVADDPYDLAMKYGATCTAAANLLALIEEAFVVKKKKVTIDSDFLANEMLVLAKINIAISLGRFLRLYTAFSRRYYNEFNRILIIKKAVQTNESESS